VDFLFKRECLIILVLSTFTTRRVGKTDRLSLISPLSTIVSRFHTWKKVDWASIDNAYHVSLIITNKGTEQILYLFWIRQYVHHLHNHNT